jgi:hypothetical protein
MIMLRATVNSRPLTVVGHLGVLPPTQQRLLHDVLGVGPVTGQTHRIAPQRGAVLVVQRPNQGRLRMLHINKTN